MKRLLALVSLASLSACNRAGPWDAFVYEDADNLGVHETLTGFDSFEQCREAATDRLSARGLSGKGTYECGRSCRWDAGLELNMCQETRD